MSILTLFCFAKIFFIIKIFCFYFRAWLVIFGLPCYHYQEVYRDAQPIVPICSRACLKKAFCKMCVTICGKFVPDEGVVAGYDNRIRDKSPAKWGVQIAGMIFQTRSSVKKKGRETLSGLLCHLKKIGFYLHEKRGTANSSSGNYWIIIQRYICR